MASDFRCDHMPHHHWTEFIISFASSIIQECKKYRDPGKRDALSASMAVFIVVVALLPLPALADCFDDAAQYHQVNPWILRAIAAQESGFRAATVVRNKDGSEDKGMTGINSVHLPELSRFGVIATDLLDGCKSVYVAGWHLRRMVNKYGNTWEAVGAYHSKTPSKRDVYKEKIRRIIDFWIAKGIMSR